MTMNLRWSENHTVFLKPIYSPPLLNTYFTPLLSPHIPYIASLLPLSWWPYWQLYWENWSNLQDAPQSPTTMSTHLLIQLQGIPALTRDGLINHPFSVLKPFLPLVHKIQCSLSHSRISFKRFSAPSLLHGHIFPLKWISPVCTETLFLSF